MPDIILQTVDRIDVITQGTQGIPGIQGDRGLPGPPGGSALEYTAGSAIGGHRVVILNGDGQLTYASANDLTNIGRVIGITTMAADVGATCQVQNFDRLDEPSWNWDTTQSVYLGVDGLLTQQTPTLPDAKFSMVVGFPISSTSLFVNLREPIILSA
jgi:hypothetical protein